MNNFPTKETVLSAPQRIAAFIHRTPVLTSSSINQIVGCDLYFKCENFQKMGAYKMRGASHAVSCLSEEAKQKGVATHSSGNFAQALSLAAKAYGIKAYIVMPKNSPKVKRAAVLGYGAEVIMCESNLAAREATLKQVVERTGATFVHPSNDMDVIVGNSTCANELLQEVGDLDYIFAPIGGGGLIAGTALAAHYLTDNQTKIMGGEPMMADDAYQSLKAGRIIPVQNPQTIADGLRTSLGDQNFPIIHQLVQDIIRVEEAEIVATMRLVWERMKIIVEPSSAVALAAVIKGQPQFEGKKIGVIFSGGNVDVENLPF
ncbi:MAG: threonine/serine dehydratase [Chitinophagales bacterium]